MPRARLLVATSNPGKIRELRAILHRDDLEIVSPADVGIAGLEVVEDGASYQANAARKARAYANAAHLPALADDSGLEVDALDGRPGIHSARYAALDSTLAVVGDSDAANRRTLLAALAGVPAERRTARFRCVVALAMPYGPTLRFGEGTVEGRIAEDERGAGGFGYDPVFVLPDGRRMAELPAEEKNRISHRTRAVQALAWALDALARLPDA